MHLHSFPTRRSSDLTTLAQTALLLVAKAIRSRGGRGDAVPPGNEGGRKHRCGHILGRSAVCGAAAIRQSNTASGGESRYVGIQINRDALSGFAIRCADAAEKSRVHID